ncbi:hypothetical protein AMTRI_Chr02g266640 [Amborella trichopoda]|uniref:Wall-associated receptor kinase galacturonan-binding domain-containing protein n=1 Tax=Amborella trichopoda TaxID=13333 RepID=W1NWE5_AMBTC|nr:uncharacterized protein LOC18430055 [Amborella trichopoda]ERN01957.1 hypothetical protein AMTR_s00045p00055640 [Amborella trichopoda]|eukprot:XP_006840282.1 uncharacterized protein LOC18430055 [Amborella trichopoda]
MQSLTLNCCNILLLFLFFSLLVHLPPALGIDACQKFCGTISIDFPFGIDDGCGTPDYRNMLNCTAGSLFFQTDSGSYRVISIDYNKKTMVIFDPAASTCSSLQPRKAFTMSDIQYSLIPPSPETEFVLLNCSSDSPVLHRYSSLCTNFSGHSCSEIYGACGAYWMFRSNITGIPPCCATDYTTLRFMGLDIIGCSHYTTVYNADGLRGLSPLDWPFGIELTYAVPEGTCAECRRSGGTCGFDSQTDRLLCLCSPALNTTHDCGNLPGVGRGRKAKGRICLQTFALILTFSLLAML